MNFSISAKPECSTQKPRFRFLCGLVYGANEITTLERYPLLPFEKADRTFIEAIENY